MEHKTVLILALLFVAGILLQLLGCLLYSNWWPMLTAFFYVLIPMPYLFFGGGGSSVYNNDVEAGWAEAGKFLTGFSAVGLVAVPAILAHAQYIDTGAMIIELAAAFIIGAMVVVYDFASTEEGYM